MLKCVRAILYARVSKTMQDEALQLHELRLVAAQRGWTVVREIVDHVSETLAAQRVDLISVRDGAVDTTTPTGRLLFTMLGAVAAFERDLIRERSMAGQALAQERGVHCGRSRSRPELSQASAERLVKQLGSNSATARAAGMSRTAFLRRLGVRKSPE